MADKEATVYIVDVGRSMGEKRHGRDVSDLDWALQYVWDRLASVIATDRKTLTVGVIGLRTDGSANELDEEEAYQHISILKGIGQALMPDVRRLRKELVPSGTDAGDAISALVIAVQMIVAYCKKLKYTRRIVLVTNGHGSMDTDGLEDIVGKLQEDKIELVILGVDFDDAEYGYKEEGKDEHKANNEATLKKIADDCDGVFGTLAQAIEELAIPRMKITKPIQSFKGLLTLGDPTVYDTAMYISVERYPRTSAQKPPSASTFVIRSDMAPSETQTARGQPNEGDAVDGLAAVKNTRTYQVKDENAPGGKKDVEFEELAKGYSYGSTAVPIAESDTNVTTFESTPGLDIIGFVAKELYNQYLDMDRTHVIIAQRTNDKDNMALSSLIHSLYELDSYAVARLVPKENKAPTMVLLAPSIEPDHECLFEVELPFAEDLRPYRFPPLDRVITVSGKEMKSHRNLPSDALTSAMSDYVDAMDLSTFGPPDEETSAPTEHMPLDSLFSPVLHRVQQVVRHRAAYPDAPLPPVPPILIQHSTPPPKLLTRAEPAIAAILAAADMKRVPPKALARNRHRRDAPKPLSGLDVHALLSSSPKAGSGGVAISRENAIPEFKQVLERAAGVEETRRACEQLGGIVRDYIRHSVGDSGYGRALETIGVLREECVELEEAGWFNEFLRELKREVLGEELGGERREMWGLVRAHRLGLVSRKEQRESEVEEEEARAFLSFR